MDLAKKIIDESVRLSNIRNDNPILLENISLQTLNVLLNATDDPSIVNILSRIIPIYEGIYPNVSDHTYFVRLIYDFYFLYSLKLATLLAILHTYDRKEEVFQLLSPDIMSYYFDIEANGILKEHLILLGLFDFIKTQNYTFNQHDFELACANNHLELAKYIYSSNTDSNIGTSTSNDSHSESGMIDIHVNDEVIFRTSCRYGKLAIAKMLWQLGKMKNVGMINIHANNDEAFRYACVNDRDTARWIYETSLQPGVGKIDIHKDDEWVFRYTFSTGHIETSMWLWNLSTHPDPFTGAINLINIHVMDEFIFISVCLKDNLEMAQLLWDISKQPGVGKIKLNASMVIRFPEDIKEWIKKLH